MAKPLMEKSRCCRIAEKRAGPRHRGPGKGFREEKKGVTRSRRAEAPA